MLFRSKSTLSIAVDCYVATHHAALDGYHSLLVSLPTVGQQLLEPDGLERYLMQRLRLGSALQTSKRPARRSFTSLKRSRSMSSTAVLVLPAAE